MDEVVLLAPRQLLSGRQHLVECRTVKVTAVRNHTRDAASVANVGERICIDRRHPKHMFGDMVPLFPPVIPFGSKGVERMP